MEDRGVKPSLPPSSDWPSSFEHPFSELGQSFGVELSDPEAVREFFTDYERGCRVFGVDVYGDFSEWLAEPVVEFSGLSSRVELYDPVKIDNPEVLLDVLRMMVPLWRNPYLHALIRSDVMKVLYRGVEYRSLILRTKLKIAFASIPRKWFKVKRVDGKYALSRHIVMTITLPKERYRLSEAWLYGIKKRFREIRRFIGRRYGLKGFVAVHEVHKDGYPHLHVIFFTKKWVKVFKHYVRKNGRKCWLWRFDEKREWERALCASEELFKEGSEEFRGFIDAFALRRGKDEAVGYFLKYLEKVEDVSYDIPEDVKVEEFNFKPYSLFVFRIFRVRVVDVSDGVRSKMRKYVDLRIELAKDVLSREKWLRIRMALFKRKDERELLKRFYELGALIKDEKYVVELLRTSPESERVLLLERLDALIRELMKIRYPDLQAFLSRRLPSSVLASPCDYVCGPSCLPLLRSFCYDALMARVFALSVKVYEDRAFFVPLGYCVLRAVS